MARQKERANQGNSKQVSLPCNSDTPIELAKFLLLTRRHRERKHSASTIKWQVVTVASRRNLAVRAILFLIGGGEFAELRDRGGNDFQRSGYFLWSGVAAEAEAYRGAGFFWA